MLHRVLAAAVSTIALTQIASAANIPVKAPPPAPPPVFSWTGLYWGLNVGGSFGEARTDWNYFAPNLVTGATVCGFAVTCISGSDTVNMDGPIGGVQAGYNWQGGNFLLASKQISKALAKVADAMFPSPSIRAPDSD